MSHGPSIPFETNSRYPDPRIEVLDERFLKLRLFSSSVEQIASGLRWAEGPAMVWRWALFAGVRHSKQPHLALGRCFRTGQRVQKAFSQRQWIGA